MEIFNWPHDGLHRAKTDIIHIVYVRVLVEIDHYKDVSMIKGFKYWVIGVQHCIHARKVSVEFYVLGNM